MDGLADFAWTQWLSWVVQGVFDIDQVSVSYSTPPKEHSKTFAHTKHDF